MTLKDFLLEGLDWPFYIKTSRHTFGRAQLPIMEQKQLIGFLQSFIIIPFLATSLNFGSLATVTQANAEELLASLTSESSHTDSDSFKTEAEMIDSYFASRDLPLAGNGMKLVLAAHEAGLDWRLIPAIAMRESTGGEHACKSVANNYWGWHSCKSGFETLDVAITTMAKHLSGTHPNTAKYYAGKSTKQILQTYNPDSIVKGYSDQVIAIMNAIGPETI